MTTTNTYSPNVQALLSRREAVLSKTPHVAAPSLDQMQEYWQANPDSPLTLILCCADPRVIPEFLFGLQRDEVIVIRNAGGDVQKALPDILALDNEVKLKDVIVLRHTDCGTTHFHDEDVRNALKQRAGVTDSMKDQVDQMRFGAVEDKNVLAALEKDMDFLKATPLMRAELKPRVVGFVYDVFTGAFKASG